MLYILQLQQLTNIHRSKFYRPSLQDTVPVAVLILLHYAKSYGLKSVQECCVMFNVYPPASADEIFRAKVQDNKPFTAMGFHSDGMN